tara:strand:+ start:305 stop:601 length:297 start_codon:yes stop_codon:yes gene_type:complete
MPYVRVTITKSDKPKKKYKAVLYDKDNKTKTIYFGSAGASDFTKNKDEKRKQLYINRHRKRENWTVPDTAGSLAKHILWNKPTLRASITDYKRRFNLS